MARRHVLLAAMISGLVGCTPSANTHDASVNELVDLVVAKEASFHQCLEIGGPTSVVKYRANYPDLISGLHTDSFDDEKMTLAARAVAVSLDEALRTENVGVRVIGEPDSVDAAGRRSCSLRVDYPLFSQEYAFVGFSAPSGVIGAYAFERNYGGWRVAERFHFGFW